MTAFDDYLSQWSPDCIVCEDTSPFSAEDLLLRCAACGWPFIEVVSVALIDSSGRTVTAYPGGEDGAGGLRVQNGIQPVEGQRRHVVTLSLACEQGCLYSLQLTAEKGVTLVGAEVAAAVTAGVPTLGGAA